MIVQWIAVASAFYGNIMAVVQGQFKRVIAYSSVAHTGYMLMMVCLNPDEAYEKQLIAYLVVYSLTATGIILILNQFAELNKNKDGRDILKAGFYRNKGLSVMLVIFVLSLAGIPLTSGFAMKYMLFTNFFREGFTLEASSIFISSIIGFAYYIRFVSDLFTEDESKMSLPTIKTRFSESLVHVIILVSIFTIGIAPSLFLGLK
jgi:NADH-quinone oxidoreductase subunit N